MLRKKYELKELKKDIDSLLAKGKSNINLLELLNEIGFNPGDIIMMYKYIMVVNKNKS